MKQSLKICGVLATLISSGCIARSNEPLRIPAAEYAARLHREAPVSRVMNAAAPVGEGIYYARSEMRARFQPVSNVVTNADAPAGEDFVEVRHDNVGRDYNGPLSLGEPGVTASLWQESSGGHDLFRDQRAFQPMDLITIIVSEDAKGSKNADTEVKEETEVQASLENLVGVEDYITKRNKQVDLANLIKASTTNDFKGEGKTKREGKLSARISAMVVEVMPSGVLRIEGEKIISVNGEDEHMVISGLVRTRDVTSENEVQSAKIANLRVDFYGNGVVGEAQNGGWMSRLIRLVWPF